MNDNPNPKESQSQNQKILAYLMTGNKITSLEALEKFKCFRLASRITDLKYAGHDIKSKYITTATSKRVKQYWMDITNITNN